MKSFVWLALGMVAIPQLAVAQSAAPAVAETHLPAPPQIIGAGVISTPAEEFKAAVTPDNKALFYVVTDHLFRHMTIVESHKTGSEWGTPNVAAFSGVWRDGDPSISPDGKTLFFISNRPMPGDPPGRQRRDFNIWSIPRNADGSWGEPAALDRAINTDTAEFAPSVTASGTLYFSRGDYMFRAEKRGTGFGVPERLPMKGGDPSIAPDESFIVFDDDGPIKGDADLFVSCRTAAGWSAPSRFAEPVSSKYEEGDPTVSADGRTLMFFSRRYVPSDRAPREKPATFAELQHEMLDNIYNESRNLYEVALPAGLCAGR